MDKAISNLDQLLKKDNLSIGEIAITLIELQKLLKEEAAAPTTQAKPENSNTEKMKYRIKFLCRAITEIESTKVITSVECADC